MKLTAALLLAASAPAAEPELLTMEEAVRRALLNHPEARAARASEAVALAQQAVAQAWRSPELRFSRANVDLDPATIEERSTLGVRFSIPRPREMSLKSQAVLARRDLAAAESRGAEARLAVEVRLAYTKAAIAEERVRVAKHVAAVRREMQQTVLRQVSNGLKEADEAELASLSAEEAETAVRAASVAAASERRKLARLIGAPGEPHWQLSIPARLGATPAASEVSSHAEMEALAAECRQYRAAEALARNERYPWLSFAQLNYRTTAIADRGAWGFQVGVELPLFRTAAAAQARVAAAQRARCELQREALKARIQAEVEESAASVEELHRQLDELERLREGPASRTLERMRIALEAGRADRVEVLTAELRVLALRERWLERRLQYAAAESRMEAALGGAGLP